MWNKVDQNRIKLIITALLVLTGCASPFVTFPGKALVGEANETSSFGFASEYALLKLEVNPEEPYSVILRTTVIEEELYIDAAPGRKWATGLRRNPLVRIALGKTIYPATAVPVFDEAITRQFLADRTIYRIDPRPFAE
ncbi:MAG: hypothetical protein ACI8Z1_001870 [Candidatus Azotimanducaceae bacterium]|jgi:hypothetical protein